MLVRMRQPIVHEDGIEVFLFWFFLFSFYCFVFSFWFVRKGFSVSNWIKIVRRWDGNLVTAYFELMTFLSVRNWWIDIWLYDRLLLTAKQLSRLFVICDMFTEVVESWEIFRFRLIDWLFWVVHLWNILFGVIYFFS